METVAQALELSEETVRQRLSRGRKLLQEEVALAVEQALGGSAATAPHSIADVLEIDQATRSRVEASMTELCH